MEINDIGFQRREDGIRHYTWIGYQTLKPDNTFRKVGINYNHWSVWVFGGNHNSLMFNTNTWQNWKNNWFTNIGVNYEPMAKEFNNRISPYVGNQVSLANDIYAIDDDLDGSMDFSFDNPDFSFVQFRSNLVVRWEYTPGSEIYLVWSQDLSQSGNPHEGLFNDLQDNIFNNEKTAEHLFDKSYLSFYFITVYNRYFLY